jgi:hypothetical protein
MISVGIDKGQIARLQAELKNNAKRLPIEIKIAINAVAKQVSIQTARDVGKVMPLKSNTLKKVIRQKSVATNDRLGATIRLGGGYPIPLRLFGAKRTKKGVAVRMDRRVKGKQGRKFLPNAFIVDRYRGNVFERKTTARGPIEVQKGPAPSDYYEELGTVEKTVTLINAELPKQIDKRIRFLRLKAEGGLRGKQR